MIGVKTENWVPLIIYLIASKLDPETLCQWEQFKTQDELPTIIELKSFLTSRADFLEKVGLHKHKVKPLDSKFKSKFQSEKCLLNNTNDSSDMRSDSKKHKHKQTQHFSCFYCKGRHAIYQVSDRFKVV